MTPVSSPASTEIHTLVAGVDEAAVGPTSARWAEGFEQVGAWLWPPFAGVILMEAVKQTFAVKPRASRARVRVFAPGVLAPAPHVDAYQARPLVVCDVAGIIASLSL